MGAGLAGRPPCLPHSQVLMGAGLAGRTSLSTTQSGPYGCWVSWEDLPVYHSQVLMGAGLAGRPPCLPHSQVLMGDWVSWETSLLPQSGPYGCWVSWETSLSTTVRSLRVTGLAGRPPCLPHSRSLWVLG